MESECRVPVACCRPRVLVLHALFWGLVSLRVFGSSLLSEDRATDILVVLLTDGIRGASELHPVQQGRVQELPLRPAGGASLLEVRGGHAGSDGLLLGACRAAAALARPPRLREGAAANRVHLETLGGGGRQKL
ncbi:protein JTB isoform X2 [Eleginops maclovinus]|uniref:protein JTB isoform X2 n=1 Tax=Eleginops maclovinus TaxID=56733 RepID=UPI003080544C